MKIQAIDEAEFYELEGIRRIIAHDHARKFAAIDFDNSLGRYGLSWRSDLIAPIIESSSDKSTVWLGVDQQLAAISLPQGRILVSLPLGTNIIQILVVSTITAVLTELEVLLFNSDGSIRCVQGLPDLPAKMSVYGDDLVIQFLEGESWKLDIQTGTFRESAIAS